MAIRYAGDHDFLWIAERDTHVSRPWVARRITGQEYCLAELPDGQLVGFLRFCYFWGKIPYMEMIWVDEAYRGQSFGTELVAFWQHEMRRRGARLIMTSSMKGEAFPASWHKKNGFREAGALDLGGFQPMPEMFYIKEW